MELGGKVTIDCEKTNHRAELEFKLKVRDAVVLWTGLRFVLALRQGLAIPTSSFIYQQGMCAP